MGKRKSDSLSQEEIERRANEILKKMHEENLTAQEALGVDDAFLEEMYSLAHAHYERGNYKESIALFQFLAGISPTTHKYMLGLAANYHQIGQYEDAIKGFTVALHIDPTNPVPTFYIGDCLMKMGREEEAIEFFEIIAEIGDEATPYLDLREKGRLILKSLYTKYKK